MKAFKLGVLELFTNKRLGAPHQATKINKGEIRIVKKDVRGAWVL